MAPERTIPRHAPRSRTAKPQPRVALSREVILAAAFKLVSRDGFEALTMRAVASALGIGAMTPYTYFRGRDELVAALLDDVLGTIQPEVEEGADWRVALRSLARSHREMLRRFPSAIPYFLSTPMTGPSAVGFGEVVMRVLRDAGFAQEQVTGGFFSLLAMNYGFAAFEARRRPGEEREGETSRRTQIELATLSEDEFPITVALSASIAQLGRRDNQYDFGLTVFIAGLESIRVAAPL
jgi:AcrR family transcriptional regulator